MSTKTGVAPTKRAHVVEEMKVNEGTITSSPGPMFAILSAAHSADEPF